MALYAYADETAFDINRTDGIHALGYGIFMSKVPIECTVIEEAMQNLSKDQDFDLKLDARTIQNVFFIP